VSLAGGGHLLTQTLTLASYLVLARLTTPTEFGKFVAGSIFIGVGSLFAESGMAAALIHRRDRVQEAASTAFVATVLAGVAIAATALLLSPLIGWFFHSREVGLVAAALSGYFVLRQTIVVPDALMQRRFSFIRRGLVEPAAIAAFGVTASIACANGSGVWGLVLGTYASVLVQVLLSWLLARWRPNFRLVSVGTWRELVGFGRHVVAGELVRRIGAEIGTVVVGRFLSTGSLGNYYYAQRVAARPLAALVDSTSYVLFPAFARIAHDEERFRAAFVRALRWMCVIAFPASLILFPLGEPFVVLLFGERWHDAGYALTAMSAYAAGHSMVSLASEVFKASGRPNLLFRMHVVSAFMTAGFMIALLPFGLVGVAAAVSLSAIGVATYAVRTVARVLDLSVRVLLTEIWPPALAATTMAAIVFVLDRTVVNASEQGLVVGVLLLGAEAVFAMVTYLGVLAIVAPSTGRALLRSIGIVRTRFRRRDSGPPAPPSNATDISLTRGS
jgi:PST family polysaccharide transporter